MMPRKFSAYVERVVFTHDFLYCYLELNHNKIAKVVAYSSHMRLTCMADTCFRFFLNTCINWADLIIWNGSWN